MPSTEDREARVTKKKNGAALTDVREVARELHRVNDRAPDRRVALDAKVQHPPKRARAEEPQRLAVRRVRLEPEVRHPRDLGVRLEPLGERHRVVRVALAAQAERLAPLQEEERGEGVHRGPEVAHDVEPALDGEDGVAEALREHHPVVPVRGLGELGELAGPGPVELACAQAGR